MKQVSLAITISFIILIIFSSAIVLAKDETEESKRNDLNARLEHINCRIDLTKKQIDILSSINPEISSNKAVLDADYSKLQEFAAALSHKDFDKYLTTTFKEDLRDASDAIRSAKTDLVKKNFTREQKIALRDSHKTVMSEFADCVNQADKEMAEARADHLNSWIVKWNNLINGMKSRGDDTTEMQSVVADAQNKLLPAIEKIKISAKDNRRTAMQDARNLHLHLWAKFEVARLRSYLASIENEAADVGYKTEIDTIKNKLQATSNITVAGKRYAPGEFEAVWKSIRDTAQLLKDLNRKLKA